MIMLSEGRDQFYANVTAIPEYAVLRCNLLLFVPTLGELELKGAAATIFLREN